MKQINTINKPYWLTTVLLFLSTTFLVAQNSSWSTQTGSASNDTRGYNMVQDAAGNVYSTGVFQGTVDFNPGAGTFNLTSGGGSDVYVLKQDADGNFIWAFAISCTGTGDAPTGITIDPSGNVLLTGSFSGTADFDPSGGTFNLSYHNPSGFGAKYDANGNFIWAGHMISGGGVSSNCIATDASGAVYMAGGFSETPDFDPGAGVANLTNSGNAFSGDAFITKWDANGTFVWVKAFHSFEDSRIQGIALDASGNIYTTGSFSGFTDFDPGAGSSFININTTSDAFISKLDASGNFVWVKQLGGTAGAGGGDIDVDASGNVYTVGSFAGTADADPNAGTSNITSAGGNDFFVQKLDASGNLVWANSAGGTGNDIPIAVDVTAAGGVLTGGYFDATADFDPSAGTMNLTPVGGNDAFVQKLTDAGAFEWAINIGGSGTELTRDVIGDASNGVYVAGQFQNTADFDPTAGTSNLTAAGSYDAFLAKYIPCDITAPNALYWSENSVGRIQNYDLQTTTQSVVASGLTSTSGVAIDSANNVVYWISTSGQMIQKQDLPCGAITTIVTGLGSPRDLELDLRKGKIYWTDLTTGKVQKANLDGTNVQDVLTGLNQPLGIDLDLTNEKIYVAVLNAGPSIIVQANLDGTGQTTLVNSTDARDVVVDPTNNKMYWTSGTLANITQANLDGTGATAILSGLTQPYGITMNHSTGKLYFTESTPGRVREANTDGTGLTSISTGLSNPIFINMPSTETPLPGTALDFDGTNDYVDGMAGFAEQSFTVEMWLNPAASQSNLAIIVDNNHSGSQNWVLQQNFANTNQYWFFTPSSPDIFFNLPANTWSHVVLVNENATNGKKVYVNGVLQAQVTPTGTINYVSTNLRFGHWFAGGRPWRGKMDEVRIWNRALCLSEIVNNKDCELTGTESGLTAYYKFNQGTACQDNSGLTTADDATANNNDGTLNNFALNGDVSNWIDGSGNGVSGTCSAYLPSEARLVGNGVEITTGSTTPTTANDTDFESVCSATPVTKTFTFENTGTGVLSIASITSSNPAFAVSNTPATTIAASASTTIDITYTPSANSTESATITINNNDCDEGTYTFVVQGSGTLSPNDETVTAAQPTLCAGQNTTIDVGSSQSGINYYLRNDADDSVLDGPIAGTGAGLSLNSGTVTQTTTYNVYAEGTSTALNFNSNQYINSNGYPTFANNFTIEAWVNPTSTHQIDAQSTSGTGGTGGQKYMLWPTHRGSEAGIGISIGTNGISVYEHGGGYMPSLLTWANPVTGWTHIAVVYTNKQPTLYVNGVLVATGLTSTKANCYPSLGRANAIYPNSGGIGGGSYGSFDGSIDDFRLWSVSRTATEIQNNMNTCLAGNEANLYALYDFENGTGSSTLTDLTGNADNQGTLTNMDPNTDWVSGASVCATCPREMTQKATVTLDSGTVVGNDKRGEMYTFDGVDDYISTADFNLDNDFSLECWFKAHSPGSGYQPILSKPTAAASNPVNEFNLQIQSGTRNLNFLLSNGTSYTNLHANGNTGADIVANTWYHVAITIEGTDMKMYLNGELTDQATFTGTRQSGNIPLLIARYFNPSGQHFDGNIDEVRVWSTVRTQEQIREYMHLSITDCNNSGLIAYYQFDNDDAVGTVNGVKNAVGANHGTATNMTVADKVASEVAVGKGFSDRVTITGAGTVNFPYTGVNMTFGASHPNGEVVVTRIMTERPHGWSSTGLDVDDEYFVVHNYGTNTFTALSDITFTNIGTIDPADAATPNVFSLFKRGSSDFGATWGTALGNAVSAIAGTNGSVSFDNTTNITSFSQFVIGTPIAQASELPVELLNFQAKRQDAATVNLNWATATETNNQGFYIERMLELEQVFEPIAFVDGQGTTVNTTHYHHKDENAYTGVTYYRLKQVDFDGTVTYSDIRAVVGEGSRLANDFGMQMYPNPVTSALSVRFDALPNGVKGGRIKIISSTGQVLTNYATAILPYQILNIKEVETLPSAMYLLLIELDNGEQVIQKFVKTEE